MKEKLKSFLHLLSFRTIWDDEDDWEDYDLREQYVSGAGEGNRSGQSVWGNGLVYLVILLLAVAAVAAYQFSSHRHTYTSYEVTDRYKAKDITGTMYQKLGNHFVKYGSDGVTLVDGRGKTQWSSAYTIETPMTSTCGQTMMIYEEQGYQVIVLDKEGVIGNFKTDLPIMKGKVAKNGVSALMLKDDSGARIRLCSTDGTALAEIKTTLEEKGYPLALDLTDDAKKLVLSLVRVGSGTIDSTIAFYDFSSTAESAKEHKTGSFDYKDEVFPEVFFASDSTSAAIGDSGFVIFSDSSEAKVKKEVQLGTEVVSAFHDDSCLGFVLPGTLSDKRYMLRVYRYNGSVLSETPFGEGYSQIKMDSGEILLNNSGHVMAFTPKGVLRLNSDTKSRVDAFVKIPGFRKYAILSNSGIRRIKAE